MAKATEFSTAPAHDSHHPLIVHVVHRFDVGGLENGVVNLVNGMPSTWAHVILSLTDVSESFAARIHRPGIRILSLRKEQGHLISQYPRLYRLFKNLRPAIVHTRNLAALEACVPAWAAGVPVRIHGEHGWDMSDPHGTVTKYKFIRRLYRPFVNRYVALSRHLEDYLVRSVGVARGSISQIYNGVDTSKFSRRARERQPLDGSPFSESGLWIVGTVGRLEPVKHQLNLVNAFAKALELNPAARGRMRLMIVGDGSMRGPVQDAVTALGLNELVWMPGSRTDVPEVLAALDCFVLPSLSEGISNTILEAMSCSLPVIATRVGGNAELIEDGVSGTLVPADDSDAMASALVAYFADSTLARRHAGTARQVVQERFSLDRMVNDYTDVYERQLNRALGRDACTAIGNGDGSTRGSKHPSATRG